MGGLCQPVDGGNDLPPVRALATRASSVTALSLIRIEKLTPDLVPVQHQIRGIAKPVDGGGNIVEVFEVVLVGQTERGFVHRREHPRSHTAWSSHSTSIIAPTACVVARPAASSARYSFASNRSVAKGIGANNATGRCVVSVPSVSSAGVPELPGCLLFFPVKRSGKVRQPSSLSYGPAVALVISTISSGTILPALAGHSISSAL